MDPLDSNLTIIIPAYNEEAAIGKVIEEVRALPLKCRVLVGDNASSDSTYNTVESYGIEPVRVRQKGKGNVIKALIKRVDTPYTVMINADYTYPLDSLLFIYNLLKNLQADVVIGCRQFKEPGSMTAANTFGNWCLSLLASILYRKRVYDLCSGMWAFKTEYLQKFHIVSKEFTLEADFFINLVKNKCRLEQVPISYRRRLDNSKAKLKISDGFKIGWFLIHRRFK